METREELTREIDRVLSNAKMAIKEAQSYLISQGHVVDLAEWVTLKEYCNQFGIKNVETVLNWINRGVVPPENVRVVKEFNNTRLIKAVAYRVRKEKAV